MFADFENMIKGKMSSIKESTSSSDITRVPQRYTIKGKPIQQLKLLSQGSFGFIWLAEDINTKQKYALKRIVCITNDRFQLAKNQLDLMSKLPKSKYLVGCFGGELVTLRNGNSQNKVLVILMEYCPNGTLFDLLQQRENKGFSQKQLLTIAHSILQGLKTMHQVGYYHQDVKIQNVLLGQDKIFKLCDFGSCSNSIVDFKQINKSQYNSIKEDMQAVTTPMYRPPEIVDPYQQFQVSNKVDIWMVGCVLYTLSYFTHPFVDSNAIGIANGVYRFPKYPEQTKYQVSQKMKDFIRNLLTPNPAFRPNALQSLQIVSNWSNLTEIPLNKQARRRKQEELEKEKQLEKLNRKVVDFDGDIPEDMLLELQKKLKNKEAGQVQIKGASFVTSKDTKLIKQGKSTIHTILQPKVHSTIKTSNFVHQPTVQQSKDQQNSFDMNTFWNPSASKPAPIKQQDKFASFSNFFAGSSEPAVTKKQTSNNNKVDMYDYFFTGDTAKPQVPKNNTTKTSQVNLLDL